MSTGIFNSSNFVAANVQPSFAEGITYLMPNGTAPLFGITSMLPKATAINPTHSFWKKTMLFQQMATSAAATNVATTLTVVSTADIVPGMMFWVDEGNNEIVLIVSVDSATQVTVARGVGSVAAAAISSGSKLYFVGNANEEASNRPTAVKIAEVQVSNYTQIFRNSWAISGTAAAVQKFVGEDPVADNKQDCAKFHGSSIEHALIHGQKYSGTRNGKPFRTMGGLIDDCRTNSRIAAAGSTTSFSQLEALLDEVFDVNTDPAIGSKRLLFVGGTSRQVLNNIGRLSGQYQIVDGQNSYGLQFTTFRLTRGEFTMIEHPLFNTNSTWKKYALAVDMGAIRVPYLGGRDTVPEEYGLGANGQVQARQVGDSGIDAIGGSLLTELTLEVRNSFANKLITNLTAASAT